MPEHTPGPWTVEERISGLRVESRLTEMMIVRLPQGDVTDEDRANLELIAAAPELLAACRSVLAWFEAEIEMLREEDGIEEPDWMDGPVTILKAAIARVEGE